MISPLPSPPPPDSPIVLPKGASSEKRMDIMGFKLSPKKFAEPSKLPATPSNQREILLGVSQLLLRWVNWKSHWKKDWRIRRENRENDENLSTTPNIDMSAGNIAQMGDIRDKIAADLWQDYIMTA
ncbi:hypothetical protein LguiB_003266 [Lonicera macranthoides]